MTEKKLPFELDESMLRELEAERRGAQMVARAQARMIINLFGSALRSGDNISTVAEAALSTTNLLNSVARSVGGVEMPPQLVAAVNRYLIAGCEGNEAIGQRCYAELLEQLMEHHFDLGQQPAGKR
jgi:hypothetical protein